VVSRGQFQWQGWNLLDDLGSDHFTRAAPCREAVDDHKAVLDSHDLLEFILAAVPSH
jgi:hypothetical protein